MLVPRNEDLAERRREEREKCILGAPTIVLPALGSRIRLRETSGCSRGERASKRASERLHRPIPWNGMERNGMAGVLQNISFHRISAPQLYTARVEYNSGTSARARVRSRCKYFSVSFVLGVRCHRRRHRRLWRYSGSFLCVRSTYRCDASLSVVIGDRDRLPWYCPRPSFLSCEIDDNRSRDHCYLISTFYGHSWCCIVMRAHVHT